MTMHKTALRSGATIAQRDLNPRLAVAAAVAAMAGVVLLDLMTDGQVGLLYSTGFVLICITVPMSVQVRSLIAAGILPPLLFVGTICLLASVAPDSIATGTAADSVGQRLIVGVIDLAPTLVIGHVLALVAIVVRIVTAPDLGPEDAVVVHPTRSST